jgi:hypothetical protein
MTKDEVNKLRRYLAEAFKRGADKERAGKLPDDYERLVRESEIWANMFVDIRIEKGLIVEEDEGFCQSWYEGKRCELVKGHSGSHFNHCLGSRKVVCWNDEVIK